MAFKYTIFLAKTSTGKTFVSYTKRNFETYKKWVWGRAKNNPQTPLQKELVKSHMVEWAILDEVSTTKELTESVTFWNEQYQTEEEASEKRSLTWIEKRLDKVLSGLKNKELRLEIKALLKKIDNYRTKNRLQRPGSK